MNYRVGSLEKLKKEVNFLKFVNCCVGSLEIIATLSYMAQEIKQYSYFFKEQIKSKKKLYINDNGILAQTSFKFSKDYGKNFENLVYTELIKKGYEIYFYNKNFECDFIVKKDGKLLAIQVCYELTLANRERELNGLRKLKFNLDERILVTYNQLFLFGIISRDGL